MDMGHPRVSQALLDLAARVEAGEGADRELDLAIARAVVPDVIVLRHNRETGTNDPYTHWEYTGSIDDAVALMSRVLPDWHWSVSQQAGGFFRGNLWSHRLKFEIYKLAPTPARALLAAALQELANLADATQDEKGSTP